MTSSVGHVHIWCSSGRGGENGSRLSNSLGVKSKLFIMSFSWFHDKECFYQVGQCQRKISQSIIWQHGVAILRIMDEVTVKDNTQELVCEWSELGERSGHIFDMFPHLKDIQCDLMAGLKCGETGWGDLLIHTTTFNGITWGRNNLIISRILGGIYILNLDRSGLHLGEK